MIKVFIGVVIGLILFPLAMMVLPSTVSSKIRATGDVVSNHVDTTMYDICRAEFLDKTSCFQHEPVLQCEIKIKKACK